MNLLATDQSYGQFLSGKRVAIVGPAKHIEGACSADRIESHDIIVRVNNKIVPVPSHLCADMGERTEMLYTYLHPADVNPEAWADYGVKHVCCPLADIDPFNRDIANFRSINRHIPLRVVDEPTYQVLEQALGSRPLTGFAAICDLLKFPLKSLYVTGFDFYVSGVVEGSYVSGYHSPGYDWSFFSRGESEHNPVNDLALMRFLYRSDRRVEPDEWLTEVLEKG